MNKILIDLERLRYPNSGIANVFRNLAKGLQYLNSEYSLYYFGIKKELLKIAPSLPIIEWKKWHKFYEIFSHKFDIIHTSHQLSSYFHKKYKNTIKVLTLHDLNFLYEDLNESKRNRMLKKVNENLRNTDYLVCISNFVKEDVLKNRNILALDHIKEIFIIYNGITLPEDRKYELGRFSFLKQKKYILNIGVLFAKKNQKKLVEMLPYLQEDLVLVSSDEKEPYASEVKYIVEKLNLQHRVYFFKNVTEEEKYALIQNCQSMCHPSVAEGFGIPPIEAMAFGKPIFLSQYTSLPEIGGDIAFYFNNLESKQMAKNYLNGMNKFNSSPIEYQEKLRKRASEFNYQKTAQNYLNLYKYILDKESKS
ncbi:glycosyltransferase family 1 protein [Capnocytophaga gingivalis]|uniref:glycosyltransferase family 4 protein n=1 Tax=Capnocytophaga gingivalis TaxID=1017 RepID=UPI0028EC2DD2|nr:glycosyltransferase family 1 protein [Capnocytophaga gingivalis]